MRTWVLTFALAIALIAPPAAAALGYGGFAPGVQAQKGQGRGQESSPRGRDAGADRQAQRDERRDQLNDEERRALHRDLDKANRELYKRRAR